MRLNTGDTESLTCSRYRNVTSRCRYFARDAGEKKFSAKIRVIVRGRWQVDIIKMRPYSSFNRSHHYILIVIDVLSKYAWAVPLKNKSGSETADAIVKIIRASGRCPKNLQTDMGKELQRRCAENLEKI